MASRRNLDNLNVDEIHYRLFVLSDGEESCTTDAPTEEELSSDSSDEEFFQVRPPGRPFVPSGASSSGAGPSGLQPQVSSPATPATVRRAPPLQSQVSSPPPTPVLQPRSG